MVTRRGRRGYGQGTVYRLKDGRWRGQVLIQGRRVGCYARTEREAWQELRRILGDADRGVLPPTERLTVAAYFDRWLTDVVPGTVRPRTLRNYRDLSALYIVPTLGRIKLARLQPADVQRLYTALLDRGLAPKTVRNVHGVLRRALGQAVDWGLVPRNVATLAHPPRVPREEVVALDRGEVARLQATARGGRWEALVATALASGMRIGELLGLVWGDVDLAAGTVRVVRQRGPDLTVSEPKSAKGRRTIDLPASCVATLREHRLRQEEERRYVGQDWEDGDLVFCTHRGRPLGQRNVLRAFKALLRQAGLRDVPLHALRHTHATLLLAAGVHPKVVQERLGHATIALTLDIYSAYVPTLDRAAAEKLDALLA